MNDLVIGIDLGTTNSCAAYYYNGKLKILENSEGNRTTLSYLFFQSKKNIIVGNYAKIMADSQPESGIYEIKRIIGRKFDDPYVQNNLQYYNFKMENESNDPVILVELKNETIKKFPVDLCAAILSKIRNDVETKLGEIVEKVVITVPAYFNVNQREVTLEAANRAGFTVLKLLNEPTAAALSYYFENECREESYSLVYDLGGGTFDVAILKRNSNDIDIVAVDGDSHLGGQDFDNVLIDYICERITEKYKYDLRPEKRAMRRLKNKCEEAKKILSTAEETIITLNGFIKGHDLVTMTLTRAKFEFLANDLFKKTINIVENCLKNANLPKSEIKEVILSGGSSRIPKLQEILSEYFDNKSLNKFVNPDECVAEGAAIQAAMLSQNPKQKIENFKITDVIPLSLGVNDNVDRMDVIIRRNTPIPVSVSVPRVTVYNNQKTLCSSIFEGERSNVKNNRFLGEVILSDITPAPPGQCAITLTLTVDQNGILTVTAKEKYRDNVKDLKITYSRGHTSDSEVKNAVKDAEDHREEDERFLMFASEKSYVIDYCEAVKYNLEAKNLVDSFKKVYELCEEIKSKVERLQVKDEEEMVSLKYKILRHCDFVVRKYKFELIPEAIPSNTVERDEIF